MGNSIAAAFTPEGLIEQLAFLLLAAGILSQRYSHARAIFAIAALIGLVHALLIEKNGMTAIWWSLLLFASLLVLARRLHQDRKSRFTDEEEEMLAGILAALPRSRARHLLDQGFWLSGRQGDVLTREGEPVGHLYYLSAGEARVLSHGLLVGLCRAGDLVGEVTILSGEKASATVVLNGPARFWCAPANVLRPYLRANADVRHAIEKGFAVALRSKLRASNELIAEAGGVAA